MSVELPAQLYNATEQFLSEDEEIRMHALQFLTQFREKNFFLFVQLLSAQLINTEASPSVRARSAVFLFGCLHKRNPEIHRSFVSEWIHGPPELRAAVLRSATMCIGVGNEQFQNQIIQLLGLIFAIELSPTSLNPDVMNEIQSIISMCSNGVDDKSRYIATNIISKMCFYSLEIQINCAHEPAFFQIAFSIFNAYVNNMCNPAFPLTMHSSFDALTESILVFKRVFSFPDNQDILMPKIFKFLTSDDPKFIQLAYGLLRKIIDYLYQYTSRFIKTIRQISIAHLCSGETNKQIEACFLWLTIGDVEFDISQEKCYVKPRHRDIHQCFGYSIKAFPKLFLPLIELIISTRIEEIDAHISLEHSPEHAAFSCLSSITKATDAEALGPIFEFVKSHNSDTDWRFRYCSGLLLSAASQLPSFNKSPSNILQAFNFFVEAIGDPVPRVAEVAMWSLGRMIKNFPELIFDSSRFIPLCTQTGSKMTVSPELTSRACWLLNVCFNCFSSDDEESFIAKEFSKFADLLLGAINTYHEPDTDDAAFGALNRLIEKTPSNLANEYTRLFQNVTTHMTILMQENMNTVSHHQMIGFCSIVQAIILNLSDLILPYADELMNLLNSVLAWNNIMVEDVLPAMGAIARAIGSAFEKYAQASFEMLFSLLSREEYIHPAAIFVGDIISTGIVFSDDIYERFVKALFETFEIEDLSSQAKIAAFSALAEIAKQVNGRCTVWLEKLLSRLETEAKSALTLENENPDLDYAKSFALIMLQIYQILVPILAQIPRGDRKVRNFFHVFEKISKFNSIDEAVLPEALILINLIATVFGRKMNVYLNKPTVLSLLTKAGKSEDENISELAKQTLAIVRAC